MWTYQLHPYRLTVCTQSLPSDDENLPPFTRGFPDSWDRSHSPSDTDPLQPYPPWYHSFSRLPFSYSHSRSHSCSPYEQCPWAEPHRAGHFSWYRHRPPYRAHHSRSPSQGQRHRSHNPDPWHVPHRHYEHPRSWSHNFSYESSRSHSCDQYCCYNRRSHDTPHTATHGATPCRSLTHRAVAPATPQRRARPRHGSHGPAQQTHGIPMPPTAPLSGPWQAGLPQPNPCHPTSQTTTSLTLTFYLTPPSLKPPPTPTTHVTTHLHMIPLATLGAAHTTNPAPLQ